MAKTTCRDCNRNIVMVRIGTELVATDPELIRVVPARDRPPSPAQDQPGIVMANSQTFARRIHAERCEDYREQARRERLSAEMRAFNNRQKDRAGRSARKNRGL